MNRTMNRPIEWARVREGLVLGLVLVGVVVVTWLVLEVVWPRSEPTPVIQPTMIHVDDLFVDVNGDGRLDLIVDGEVVINKDPFGQNQSPNPNPGP